ncbi:hypothetical protein [Mucilaginibacter aquariorum]|uniref:Uncharacterized protein n=1 Tax=Mucilaginibacter aquariorum TaxID=2967225 RepID=A0ABT1T2N4_9SPHI|nr:hypothetical protein [Mucilaginibacter aquariorum]MCQ6958738.1 hypothetical protein [Mucilaginibacter aquariorum]
MKDRINGMGNSERQLKTQRPLSEKDEQARRMERMRALQAEALKLWHTLIKKKK